MNINYIYPRIIHVDMTFLLKSEIHIIYKYCTFYYTCELHHMPCSSILLVSIYGIYYLFWKLMSFWINWDTQHRPHFCHRPHHPLKIRTEPFTSILHIIIVTTTQSPPPSQDRPKSTSPHRFSSFWPSTHWLKSYVISNLLLTLAFYFCYMPLPLPLPLPLAIGATLLLSQYQSRLSLLSESTLLLLDSRLYL